MTSTLFRYVFTELLKILLLAIVPMSFMISIGMIVGPVQKYGIGLQHLATLLQYVWPEALLLSLPVSAMFAASFVYGRLSADNELNACRAGGINAVRMIWPAAALGVMVLLANLLLANYVIPTFAGRFKKTITADASRILRHKLNRDGRFRYGPYVIYASQVRPDADGRRLNLFNVVGTEFRGGQPRAIAAAQVAAVRLRPVVDGSSVDIYMSDAVFFDRHGGRMLRYKSFLFGPLEFPSPFRDDVGFKHPDELRRIERDPTLFGAVRRRLEALRAAIRAEAYYRFVVEHVRSGRNLSQPLVFRGRDRRGRAVEYRLLQVGGVSRGKGGIAVLHDVILRELEARTNRELATYQAESMELEVASDGEGRGSVVLTLHNVTRSLLEVREQATSPVFHIGRIEVPAFVEKRAMGPSWQQLMAGGNELLDAPAVRKLHRGFVNRVRSLWASIRAERHARAAFSVDCLVLVLLGALLGALYRGGHVLTAFGISFAPAALTILLIALGKHFASGLSIGPRVGLPTIWTPLLAVALLDVVLLWVMARR